MSIIRVALILTLSAAMPCFGQKRMPDRTPHQAVVAWPMPVSAWSLSPSDKAAPLSAFSRRMGIAPTSDHAEQIFVYGQSHKRDEAWREDIQSKQPGYEAANSDAAMPLIPYAAYTSADQQRMMSEKTDAMGLCGALGGYVQCPNLPR